MRLLAFVIASGLVLVGCEDPTAPEVASEVAVEEVTIHADALADGETLELELADDVVYRIEPGVPLDRVLVVTEEGVTDLASIVGERVGPDDGLVFGSGPAMDAWSADAALHKAPAGCWWEYVNGQWVRYCIA